jgi:hypothetical protein
MHERYAPDGLVCASVSVDEVDDKERVLTFLKSKKATFANYLLDETAEVWQNEWQLTAPPAVLVYGRNGKLDRKFDNEDPQNPFDYADVEPLVRKLLNEKP